MKIDLLEGTWKDVDTLRLFKIEKLKTLDDLDLVWYRDKGTGEMHCMSSNMFTLKHIPCGSFELA